jgi:hypothetical protein
MRRKTPPSKVERFLLREGGGAGIPLPDRRESANIAAWALRASAADALGQASLPRTLRRLMALVAFLEPQEAALAATALIHPKSRAYRSLNLSPSDDVRADLVADTNFRNLVSWFTFSSLAVAPVHFNGSERRVLELNWDEYLGAWRNSLATSLGLRPKTASVSIPLLGAANSQHVEVEVPREVEIPTVRLLAIDPEFVWNEPSSTGRGGPGAGYRVVEDGRGASAKIYLSDALVPRQGSLRVDLRIARRGFVSGSIAAAGLIAATLWFFVFASASLLDHPTSAASVLLLVPGLLVAYLLRPGEHLLSKRLRDPMRGLLAFDGLLVLIAAGVYLSLGPSSNPADHLSAGESATVNGIWLGCAILSTAVLMLLSVGRAVDR